MIMYNFGEIPCKIDFNDFLCLTTDVKMYKSEFNDFSELYEFIEKNINNIKHILFNNYEYILENGKLHNLYGPAIIRYSTTETPFSSVGTKINWFYINGKLVCNNLDNRGCKNMKEFESGKIFHVKILTTFEKLYDPYTGRELRKREGVDYIKEYIDLGQKIKNDQRKKKLKYLNDK